MADPLSILQVAGIGVQLVKTLYTYGKSVHDSQNEIAAVAREVELTCQVLDNLAKVLQQDNAQSMCSATLKADASNTLNGCKAAFKELDSALQTTLKSQKGVKSKSRLPFSTRAKWPLDKTKIASLQSNLERLKTTLSLMLDVINLALKQTEEYVSPTDQDSISLISLANPPISQYKQQNPIVSGSNASSNLTKSSIRVSPTDSRPIVYRVQELSVAWTMRRKFTNQRANHHLYIKNRPSI